MFIYHANFPIGNSISIDFLFGRLVALWKKKHPWTLHSKCWIFLFQNSDFKQKIKFYKNRCTAPMLILFPNAPARHKVSHRVLCEPLLPVKVKLPLSFLRFFAPVAGSWSFVRAPAPPAHHKTTRMHGSLRQVGHQHTPPPLSTHSQQSTWLDTHQHMRLRSDGKEAGRDIVFFIWGGRQSFRFR